MIRIKKYRYSLRLISIYLFMPWKIKNMASYWFLFRLKNSHSYVMKMNQICWLLNTLNWIFFLTRKNNLIFLLILLIRRHFFINTNIFQNYYFNIKELLVNNLTLNNNRLKMIHQWRNLKKSKHLKLMKNKQKLKKI